MAAQITETATTSTHGAALVRGAHQLRIRGHDRRKRIKSRGFEAGGHLWAVSCAFNDGWLSSVSLELLHTDSATDVVAMATLRIENPGGTGSHDRCRREAEWRSGDAHVFPAWPSLAASAMAACRSWELSLPNEYRWHRGHFVNDDGCCNVYCAVDVLQAEDSSDGPPKQISVVPLPTISADLGRLLLYHQPGEPETELELWRRQCMLPDVTFIVEQTEIQAHRLILATRSPVFAAEFRWHTITESTLHVHDISASTFRDMLHFIYTDELPPSPPSNIPAMALDLFIAADRYAVERLRLLCEKILSENLDVASVMPTLMAVYGRQSCQHLEDLCIQYMASDPDVYAAVKATEDYKELNESCCYFILEVTDKVARISMANAPGPDAPSSSSSHQPRRRMNTATRYSSEEMVEGTHEFKIPHFIAVKGRHGVGKEISSDTFHVGGYDWKIKVYPSSSSEKAEGHVSMYVELVSDPGAAGVKATVCLKMDCPGEWPPSEKWLEKTFTTKSDWGYAKFITIESAKSHHLAKDGSLTIHCDVSITKKVCATTCTLNDGAPAMVSPSNIVTHLEQRLVDGQGSDMTFLARESELQAHSLLIAARSQILYEAVAVANKDDHHHTILVNDTTIAVFKAILHFIYTDKLPLTKDLATSVDEDEVTIAQDLLVAACWFRLDRMKAMCENLLASLVSKENALSTLELARNLHCSNLEDYCSEFIWVVEKFQGRFADFRLLNSFSIY